MSLTGLTAFVTGASRGIGQTIATTLADEGAKVALAARSDGIDDTAERIEDGRALPVRCDVTDEQAVEAAIDETVETFGGLDCLVNNAGVSGPTASIEDVSIEEFRRTIDVNLTGAVRCAKHAAPHLRESGQGRIVSIASIGGKMPYPNRTPYASAKMGLIGLNRALAGEFGDDGVTVNTICPGGVRGERLESVIRAQAEERGWSIERTREELYTGDLFVQELVEPEEIAELITHLVSEAGRHITAQDLNVDSGKVWY